jgi:hypothetical protein
MRQPELLERHRRLVKFIPHSSNVIPDLIRDP